MLLLPLLMLLLPLLMLLLPLLMLLLPLLMLLLPLLMLLLPLLMLLLPLLMLLLMLLLLLLSLLPSQQDPVVEESIATELPKVDTSSVLADLDSQVSIMVRMFVHMLITCSSHDVFLLV